MGEASIAFEVAQQEGDPCRFESAPTIVNGLLEDGTSSCEFTDFHINLLSLLLPLLVVDDFGVGLPVGQLVGSLHKGIEPGGHSCEELEKPCPHRVDRNA